MYLKKRLQSAMMIAMQKMNVRQINTDDAVNIFFFYLFFLKNFFPKLFYIINFVCKGTKRNVRYLFRKLSGQ